MRVHEKPVRTPFEVMEDFFTPPLKRIRRMVSHTPFFYIVLGVLGACLFWEGIQSMITISPAINGDLTAILGIFLLLISGLLVSVFFAEGK